MAEPTASGAVGFAIYKFGSLKLLGFGAALVGAGLMAVFRPPKTRKELFMQGAVALGCSLLFGGSFVNFIDYHSEWINLATASMEDTIQFIAMVYGLIGAISWGVFGGLAVLRDKFGSDPIQTITDIKNLKG